MKHRIIYLAAGCFWGTEGYFKKIAGIEDTEVGYANGKTDYTNYQEVDATDHAETLKIIYDISKISLQEILLHYFRIIDPKSVNKQGGDRGRQYRTGIYYTDEGDMAAIMSVYRYFEEKLGDLAVEVQPLKNFVKAEDYHQDYLDNNPTGYCHVNLALAHEPLIVGDYKMKSDDELKAEMDELSYAVMREDKTERAGTSELNAEYRRGIYVDKITGEPLFASSTKFNAGCGWPSFTRPILQDKINYLKDTSHGMIRTEVRSRAGDNHLGHVFNDGPADQGGLRYCINGAAITFIPYEEMDERGYGEYKPLV